MGNVTLLLDEIAAKIACVPFSQSLLEALAVHLQRFAQATALARKTFRPAAAGEEVLYELGRHLESGMALYLVSDAPGIVSAPHEHCTWAVTVGLEGTEVNTLYRIRDPAARTVERAEAITLKAGDTVALLPDSVHATESLGPDPTYHLHLYGRPLDSLPPFAERTFRPI